MHRTPALVAALAAATGCRPAAAPSPGDRAVDATSPAPAPARDARPPLEPSGAPVIATLDQALAGPYRDLDEYCEQLRAQSQAELDPEATPDHCDDAALVRMASAREGPIDRAELLRVANDWAGSAGHACHLALRRAGEAAPPAWFVLAGEGRCDGGIGPAHTVTTELLEFDWPPGQEGRVFVVLVKERHARDEVATVDPRAQPRFARQEHANEFLQVCAPVDDALRCSPPLLLACSTIAGETVRARWRVAADGVVIEGDPAAFDDCDLAPEFRPGRVALTAP